MLPEPQLAIYSWNLCKDVSRSACRAAGWFL